MKVQVVVKNSGQANAYSHTIEANVGPAETAFAFQERIAAVANTLCFPDQQLLFEGRVVPGNMCLSACGIKDGSALELLFEACEETLVKQLSDLIGAASMSPEELSLLYIHRHLVSLGDVLKALGHADGKLEHFLDSHKRFSLENGLVKIVHSQKTTGTLTKSCKDLCGPIEVRISVALQVHGKENKENHSPLLIEDEDGLDSLRFEASDTVARAKEIIAAVEQIPFPHRELLLQGKKLEDGLSLHDAGVTNGDILVMKVHASEASLISQLGELLSEWTGLSPNDLSLHYCQRFGTPVCQALRILGLPANLRRFLESRQEFSITGGCVTLSSSTKLITA